MKLILVLLLALSAVEANAQTRGVGGYAGAGIRPVVTGPGAVYVDRFLGAANLSLKQDPFFASKMLGSFEKHLGAISTARNPKEVAAYLRGVVMAPEEGQKGLVESLAEAVFGPETEAQKGKKFADRLGTKPLEPEQAGALLLANALASPETFNGVLSGLEAAKPGLGRRFPQSLLNAGNVTGANPHLVAALRKLGSKVGPQVTGFTYDSKGKLDTFFDNTRPTGGGSTLGR